MDITINICTYNNSVSLKRTLQSLQKCCVPEKIQWEVIVVNNNCNDDTEHVVAELMRDLPIIYLLEPIPGLSRARNAALAKASGNLLIFSDDDVEFVRDWLSSYWFAFLDRPTGHFFGGPIEPVFPGYQPDRQLLEHAMPSVKGLDFGKSPRILRDNEYFIGANWACPQYLLKEIGSFDITKGLNHGSCEVHVGEERDLIQRLKMLKCNGYYVPQAKIRHYVPVHKCTVQHIRQRKWATGRLMAKQRPEMSTGRFPFLLFIWICVQLGKSWLKVMYAQIQCKKNYEQYFRFYRFIGELHTITHCKDRR